jgi:hypothetical protein
MMKSIALAAIALLVLIEVTGCRHSTSPHTNPNDTTRVDSLVRPNIVLNHNGIVLWTGTSDSLYEAHFSGDGKRIVCFASDTRKDPAPRIYVFDAVTGNLLSHFACDFRFLEANETGTVLLNNDPPLLIDAMSGATIHTTNPGYGDPFFSSTSDSVFVDTYHDTVFCYRTSTGAFVRAYRIPHQANVIGLGPGGHSLLISSYYTTKYWLMDLVTGDTGLAHNDPSANFNNMYWPYHSLDGEMIGFWYPKFTVCQTRTGSVIGTLDRPGALSNDHITMASGPADVIRSERRGHHRYRE